VNVLEREAGCLEHLSKIHDLLSIEVLAAGPIEDLRLVAERYGEAAVASFGDRANLR